MGVIQDMRLNDTHKGREAFSIKQLLRVIWARNREVLVEEIGVALTAVSVRDAQGFSTHCGYRVLDQQL